MYLLEWIHIYLGFMAGLVKYSCRSVEGFVNQMNCLVVIFPVVQIHREVKPEIIIY